jgi:hypothetical protein
MFQALEEIIKEGEIDFFIQVQLKRRKRCMVIMRKMFQIL